VVAAAVESAGQMMQRQLAAGWLPLTVMMRRKPLWRHQVHCRGLIPVWK
jgi:hypothetical protein